MSGTLATMGSALPYALAAKASFPSRPTLALVGDGAMQVTGLSALITVAQHWKSWTDPRLVFVVLNNQQLSYVTWEQRVMDGDPKFAPTQDLFDFPFARDAELLGLGAVRVASVEALQTACQQAFSAQRPLLIEAVTDPNVPPLPPQLTEKQRAKRQKPLSSDDADLPSALHPVERHMERSRTRERRLPSGLKSSAGKFIKSCSTPSKASRAMVIGSTLIELIDCECRAKPGSSTWRHDACWDDRRPVHRGVAIQPKTETLMSKLTVMTFIATALLATACNHENDHAMTPANGSTDPATEAYGSGAAGTSGMGNGPVGNDIPGPGNDVTGTDSKPGKNPSNAGSDRTNPGNGTTGAGSGTGAGNGSPGGGVQ